MSEYRSLTFRCNTEGLRTAQFHGREHIIIPVVALVEGVLHASNSDAPELVLASEFGRHPSAWNGEPVVMNHPQDLESGRMVSANSPEVLESHQLGMIFGTHVEDNQLRMLAYVDTLRIGNVGEKAQKVLAKVENAGTIEVSVGCFLDLERSAGVYKGKRYERIWRNILPDHLAFLEEGATGACSNEAGCGAGISRAAIHVVTKEGFTLEGEAMAENKKETRSLRERLISLITFKQDETEVLTDEQIRAILADENAEPVAAAAAPVAAAGGCGCGGKVSAEGAEGGIKVHKNAERITALIANPKTVWSEHDRTYLESVADDRLSALEAHAKPEPVAEPVAKPEPAAAAAKTEPKLEELPAAWQAAIRANQELETKTRGILVEKLTAAQEGFTKADLEAMSFEALQKLGKAVLKKSGAEVLDFAAAAGNTRAASSDDDEYADDAPDLGAVIRSARGIK